MYLTKENVEAAIEHQQKALQSDNPDSKCAANHRGYIKAMELILEWMEKDEIDCNNCSCV